MTAHVDFFIDSKRFISYKETVKMEFFILTIFCLHYSNGLNNLIKKNKTLRKGKP